MRLVEKLVARYAVEFPAEVARRLDGAAATDAAAILAALEPHSAVLVIELMLVPRAAAVLLEVEQEKIRPVLDALSPSRVVAMLRHVNRERQGALLDLLPQRSQRLVERSLRSPEGTAGIAAEPLSVVLLPQMTVAEAREIVHQMTETSAFVVDDDHRLIGVVNRRELLRAEPLARIENLMIRSLQRLPSSAPLDALLNHPGWTEHDLLPVVDGNGVLVGGLRHLSLRRRSPAMSLGKDSRAPLATLLELGELYWAGLAAGLSVMSGRAPDQEARDAR